MTGVQELWIPGPLPGQNEMTAAAKGFAGRGYGYAKMKRNWTDTIALLAKAAKLAPVARARFHFAWFEKTRRRDPDNFVAGKKFVLDGLVLAGVLPGDRWANVESCSDSWAVSAHPGVRVTIESVLG